MEDSSHDLIDQMIAKEQYCYGFDNVSSLNTNNTPTVISSQQPQVQFAMVQMGPEIKVEEKPQVSSTRHKKEAKNGKTVKSIKKNISISRVTLNVGICRVLFNSVICFSSVS